MSKKYITHRSNFATYVCLFSDKMKINVWIQISGTFIYVLLCFAISKSKATFDCSNVDPSLIKPPIVKQLDKNGRKVQVSLNENDR